MSSARCPLRLDSPWSPGGVDQQVLQELPAAQQQVGQGRSGDPRFGDKVFRSYARTYANGEVYHKLSRLAREKFKARRENQERQKRRQVSDS